MKIWVVYDIAVLTVQAEIQFVQKVKCLMLNT